MQNPTKSTTTPPGFALVITISLLVLLTIVAVGLLTLSSVSLRSASRGEAAQVARANARMALMLAIGQLQQEMGPDSRISAPHDAGKPAGASPRWVAAYDAWKSPADGATPLTPASRVPNLRSWLVSGATGATVPTAELVPLVSARSLGTNPDAEDLVSAPMVKVADAARSGRIAWWIADESAKAKITAGAAADNFATATRPVFDAQSPRFVGAQAVPELSSFEWEPKQRAAVISTDTTNLAAKLANPGIGNLSHDVTVHSHGVLTDVREGRLKRDLTNLLTRPIEETEDKPFYLANGRMNRFVIGADGSVANARYIPANAKAMWNSPTYNLRNENEWGINLEELYLFHNVHREIEWSGSTPKIVSKGDRTAAINDRFYLYREPVIEAAQFILSFRAVPTGETYRMELMLDGMVAVSNPNDIGFEYARGLQFPLQLVRIPYELFWDIRRNGASFNNRNIRQTASTFNTFIGYIGGESAAGFSLQPGEAGVFGSTTGKGVVLSLQRGFVPSGGVLMTDINLNATGLQPTDTVNFRMERFTGMYDNTTYNVNGHGGPAWTYCNYWLGPRIGAPQTGFPLGSMVAYNTPPDTAEVNARLPLVIRPSQVRPVSDFVNRPQPFLAFSFLRNVEQDSNPASPEAFPSRTHLMSEPAGAVLGLPMDSMNAGMQVSQFMLKAEPLPYQYRTLAAGAGGSNIYHGGSRQPNQGGSFNVIKRRIPLAPPLSLGAFENAIASGFARRFKDVIAFSTDPIPQSARALTSEYPATPMASKAIGNSYASPFLPVSSVYSPPPRGAYNANTPPSGGADHSWMINNALWDSWFLSGIVDGRGRGSNRFQTDGRSQRAQFDDLVNGKGLLRNERFVFHPFRPADTALKELFNGESLRPSAINDLSRYLMVDGAFNVNSTSITAWKALLSSVRNQELLVQGGGRKDFTNPYGTLGYAQTVSTTDDWSGLRDLSESELDALAREIVEQVKARGPFLNLADFVNRRPDASDPAHRAVGALQAAIDSAGLNSRFAEGARSSSPADFGGLPGANAVSDEPVKGRARSAGAAGHLTQARLLTAIGPQITVRADTFLIRTYGDARDPSGNVLAKAWCEAVVQRTPEYVDPSDLPEAADGWPTSSSRLKPINALFGRRMEIRSFRWLNSDEI